MLLERLAGSAAVKLIGLPLAPAVAYLTRLLADEKAFRYTRKELKARYQPALAPASYDHVFEHLRLSKNDLIRYYQSAKISGSIDLQQYVRTLFDERLAQWEFNSPSPELRNSLIKDYLDTYERYVLSTDTTLALLHLIETTVDIKELLVSINASLNIESESVRHQDTLVDDALMILAMSGVPFDIIERGDSHVDLTLVEGRDIAPIKIFVQVMEEKLEPVGIDGFLVRALNIPDAAQRLLVTDSALSVESRSYAARRGIAILSLSDFRQRILHDDFRQAVVIGRHGAARLAEGLNVSNTYVPPDAAPISPTGQTEELEDEVRVSALLTTRAPITTYFNDFLSTDRARLLVVLGDYGSGKSAWCARTTAEMSESNEAYLPIYISLRHLRSADDLSRLMTRSVSVARSHSNGQKRIVLFADGLDEMPHALSPNERRNNVLRLLEVCQIPDKMIVTARTSYFRGLQDFWELFAATDSATLWDRLAQFIPFDKSRPGVRAVMLHSFNNDQIDRYVEEFGLHHLHDPSFADLFLAELRSHDPHDFYRRLARTPLYLFLLVNTRPWLDPSVASVSDVVRLLIKYWLERDLEKGPSRWLLSARDRREFMSALALWMHKQGAASISFMEFDDFVQSFYRIGSLDQDGRTLALDLQTTGMFGSSGGLLFFALPAAMDLLIAEQLDDLIPHNLERIPSVNQARMWLGLIETGHAGPKPASDSASDANRPLVRWMSEHAIDYDIQYPYRINADPAGIMYLRDESNWNWPVTNAKPAAFICLLNSLLNPRVPEYANVIRARIGNSYGLHARPSARIVKTYVNWRGRIPGAAQPTITIHCKGLEVHAGSIMGVMMIAAEYGSPLQVVYENCTLEEAEDFMLLSGFRRIQSPDADWELQENQS